LTGVSDGHGGIAITADSDNDCAALPPRRVVARRAERVVTGPLSATGHCRYAGQVQVPATGLSTLSCARRGSRWRRGWRWTPAAPNRLVAHRQLYLPDGRTQGAGPPTGEVVVGALLYAVGGLLLALTIRQLPANDSPRPN
jgi:hypothetical protein